LAIYIHDEAARLRLRVTGELDERATKELASSWKTASSVVGTRKVAVDLTSLTAACERGRDLLESLHRQGVEFLAQSPFQLKLVESLKDETPTALRRHNARALR
jgi:TfoX/Sxy family transcriptional regulator of competence genes